MDTRINPLAALGLEVGDAHILRNAGGRVTEDVLRSLVLSSAVLGVEHVVVMHHTRCGLAGVSDTELRAITGTEFAFLPIADSADAIREDVAHLAAAPYLGGVSTIAGFLYNVESGKAEEIARVIREK
jgi:carbonic anhydrase